ncbi:MAG: hypothetical protein WB523_16755 [Candidatus Sulfotelmatobacter sp.]
MHFADDGEAGASIFAGLFLGMNAGALALIGTGCLHELTVTWHIRQTISRRKIVPGAY